MVQPSSSYKVSDNNLWVLPQTLNTCNSDPSIDQLSFGKDKWEKYFGDIGEVPPLPDNIVEIMNYMDPSDYKIRKNYSLILIPNSINGQVVTISRLFEIMQHPKEGCAQLQFLFQFSSFGFEYFPEELKNIPIKASYWVLVAHEVIGATRRKRFYEREELLEQWNNSNSLIKYAVPSLIEIALCVAFNYLENGYTYFSSFNDEYGSKGPNFTSTREGLLIGNFGDQHLTVSSSLGSSISITPRGPNHKRTSLFNDIPDDFCDRHVGIAPVIRLSTYQEVEIPTVKSLEDEDPYAYTAFGAHLAHKNKKRCQIM